MSAAAAAAAAAASESLRLLNSKTKSSFDVARPTSLSQQQTRTLYIFNWVWFSLYSSCAVAQAILVGVLQRSNTIPWFDNMPNSRPQYSNGSWSPNRDFLVNFPITALTPVYLSLSSIAHLFYATWYRTRYEIILADGRNPLRWIDYVLTTPVMNVQVAQLAGVMDVHILFVIAGLSATWMFFGYLSETAYDQTRYSNTYFAQKICALGAVPHTFQWGVIISYFINVAFRASVPYWLYAVVLGVFFFQTAIWIILILQLTILKQSMMICEISFSVASMAGKLLLAWVLFACKLLLCSALLCL
jgi:hypothetical protein